MGSINYKSERFTLTRWDQSYYATSDKNKSHSAARQNKQAADTSLGYSSNTKFVYMSEKQIF